MFEHFELTLVVTHACNLRCTYCYTGEKLGRVMPVDLGEQAIDRALASLQPQGTLDLGFFGGEPLLEADRILQWMRYARQRAEACSCSVRFDLTTNGTIDTEQAWQVMLDPAVALSISHDGVPENHDRHRIALRDATCARVEATLGRLFAAGKDLNVVMVVRPTTVTAFAKGLRHLYDLGVRQVTPSLDLWVDWSFADGSRLQTAVAEAAELWAELQPDFHVSCLDEKAAALLSIRGTATARCSFGEGQVAVAPSGRIYPCERIVGEDPPGHPLLIPGKVSDVDHFLSLRTWPPKTLPACDACAIESRCSTFCRCSNFIRTGDVTRPDGLLCLWERLCHREALRKHRARPPLNSATLKP
ncbi:MAG: radical SAM protein [Pirellulales bacterium]|nr:radical SAM protein [Pirellulales bacterium]